MKRFWSKLRWELQSHSLKLILLLFPAVCLGLLFLPALGSWFDSINPIARRRASARATAQAELAQAEILVEEQVGPINEMLSELRRVHYEPVHIHLVRPDELKNTWQDFPERERAELLSNLKMMMVGFNFLPESFDLEAFMINDDSSGLLGYYRPAWEEIFIISEDLRLDPYEEVVYAHEVAHAIQDQRFGLREDYILERRLLSFEGDLPYRALVEGEARLLEQHFREGGYHSQAEKTSVDAALRQLESDALAALEDIPPILIRGDQFPYTAGYAFVSTLYEADGWSAIEKVWLNQPRSTEQILHPDRYWAQDAPESVLIRFPGQPWRSIDTGVLGEFYLREYLGQQLSPEEVDIAATGWGGDAYKILTNPLSDDEEVALIFHSRWDSDADHQEFVDAYRAFADREYGHTGQQHSQSLCWQGQDATCLYDSGESVIVVRAADLPAAVDIMSTQEE